MPMRRSHTKASTPRSETSVQQSKAIDRPTLAWHEGLALVAAFAGYEFREAKRRASRNKLNEESLVRKILGLAHWLRENRDPKSNSLTISQTRFVSRYRGQISRVRKLRGVPLGERMQITGSALPELLKRTGRLGELIWREVIENGISKHIPESKAHDLRSQRKNSSLPFIHLSQHFYTKLAQLIEEVQALIPERIAWREVAPVSSPSGRVELYCFGSGRGKGCVFVDNKVLVQRQRLSKSVTIRKRLIHYRVKLVTLKKNQMFVLKHALLSTSKTDRHFPFSQLNRSLTLKENKLVPATNPRRTFLSLLWEHNLMRRAFFIDGLVRTHKTLGSKSWGDLDTFFKRILSLANKRSPKDREWIVHVL